MSDPIVTFDEAAVRGELRELVRQTVKDTLNALLEEADDLVKADRYERTAGREAYRVGRCERGLTTTSGRVTLKMPKPKSRGLSGVRMFTGDKATAMAGAIAEVFPDAAYRRCTAHFHRSALSKAPKSKRAGAAAMLEAIRAQEPLDAGMGKADAVAASLDGMRLAAAAKCVRDGVAETLARTRLPMRRWRRIRTNNAIERG